MFGTPRLPLAAAALALAALGPAPAATAAPAPPAGTNVTLPYPAKAPIVVQVNGFERSRDRLTKMIAALPPAQAAQVKKDLDAGLAQLLTGRKTDAVTRDGRIFLVVHDIAKLAEDEPAVSVLIPVTGYKEFKASFLTADERKTVEKAGDGVEAVKSSATGDERTVYLVDLKGHVALTVSKETAEEYAGKYTRAQSGAMGADLAASFLAADVALYVNMDVINDLYGEQIRQFKGLIDFALGQAQMGGMLPGLGKQELEMAKTVLHGMFQAVEDARGVVVGVEFRPEGLNLRAQVTFADDTPSARMLQPEVPSPLADVAKLPRGLNSYTGSKFGKKFADLSREFAQEFSAAEDDEAGAEQIKKLLAELSAAGPAGEFGAASAPDKGLTVTAYKSPDKAAAALVKLYKAMAAGGKIQTVVLKEKPRVTEKAVTHRGFTFTEVRLTFDFDATVQNLPDNLRESTRNQLKRVVKERTTVWVGTDGKSVVELTARDWPAAKEMLDAYLDGGTAIGADPGFQVARKNLPAESTSITLFETGELITILVEQAKAAGEAMPGGVFPPIGTPKPVKGDPTYIGTAITLKKDTATLDFFIPGGAMNVASKMIVPLFRNIE